MNTSQARPLVRQSLLDVDPATLTPRPPAKLGEEAWLAPSIASAGLPGPIGVCRLEGGLHQILWGEDLAACWLATPETRERPIPALLIEPTERSTADLLEYKWSAERWCRLLRMGDKLRVIRACRAHATGAADKWFRERIGRVLGLSPSRVSNLERVTRSPALLAALQSRKIALGAAVALASLPEEEIPKQLAELEALAASRRARKRIPVWEVERLVGTAHGTRRHAEFTAGADEEEMARVISRIVSFHLHGLQTRLRIDWLDSTKKTEIILRLPLRGCDVDKDLEALSRAFKRQR